MKWSTHKQLIRAMMQKAAPPKADPDKYDTFECGCCLSEFGRSKFMRDKEEYRKAKNAAKRARRERRGK